MIFTFSAGILLARWLGAAQYGYFNLLIACIAMGGAFSEVGLTGSATFHIPRTLKNNVREAVALGQSYFWLRILFAGIVTLFLMVSADLFLADYLSAQISPGILQLASLAILTNAVNDAGKSFLQIDTRFFRYSLFSIIGAILTLTLTGVLILLNQLRLGNAILYLLIVSELTLSVVLYHFIDQKWSLAFPSIAELSRGWHQLKRSGMWHWLSNIVEKIGIRIDLLLIPFWLAGTQLGLYALAFNLSRRLESVNHDLYTVVLPRTSELDTPTKRSDYIRQSMKRAAFISALIVGLIVLADYFVPFIYGNSYAFSANLFQWLAAIVILDVFITPFLLLFHAARREQDKTASEGIKAFLLTTGIVLLLPEYGLYGVIFARFFATLSYGGFVIFKIKSLPHD